MIQRLVRNRPKNGSIHHMLQDSWNRPCSEATADKSKQAQPDSTEELCEHTGWDNIQVLLVGNITEL